MVKVKVYSTPTCPWCKKTKEFLKENSIPYQDVNVAGDQKAAEEMFKKSGQMGVPVTDIDGQIVVGFDKPKLKELLKIGG
ncbi:glutathione S-transferase N-terminal domain-containing protein [Candidatus Woesearchaeota archaeon]|nr:glutathione S-transferase N-terminal domain-containing protein [Candidatus Woesearchaeota archaeon]